MDFNFDLIKHIPTNHAVGDAQIRTLFKWASVVEGNAVEIGCFYGRSTATIALGLNVSEKGNKVYAIDPQSSRVCKYDFFIENMEKAGIRDRVIPVREKSEVVWKNKKPESLFKSQVGLLFIDGDHTYEGVKKDLQYVDLVYRDGIIALHDYHSSKYPGIVNAVNEYRNKYDKIEWFQLIGNLILFKKL
jgi:predicted O-methyltransferase YrrM